MNYMYSLNATMRAQALCELRRQHRPNIDQVLARCARPRPKPSSRPMCALRHYVKSPRLRPDVSESYFTQWHLRATFLANYAFINLNDQITRSPALPASPSSGPASMPCASGSGRPTGQLNITIRKSSMPSRTEHRESFRPGGAEPPRRQEYT